MADQLSREGASFSAILGHDGAKAHLQAALADRQMSHAYLIEGTHGVGKTTLANAFIKTLLCQEPITRANGYRDCCNQCQSCRSFDHDNHPDVKRIRTLEDKNTISVKQIRDELVKDISVRPYGSQYKIYVIEEAERLTVEAQNAMLKTLEEPPAYGLIIMLAESAASFLSTILSRCVKISLQPLDTKVVRAELEKRGVEAGRAAVASAFAQGSIGQALKLCEDEGFEELRRALFDFLGRIPQLSQLEVMKGAQLWEQFKGEQEAIFSLLFIWYRDILVYRETRDPAQILCADQMETIASMASYYDDRKLIRITDMVLDIHKKLKANANAALAIDCLLMELK
jgi:DNA polymerase-3 subunit delta'